MGWVGGWGGVGWWGAVGGEGWGGDCGSGDGGMPRCFNGVMLLLLLRVHDAVSFASLHR